MRHKHADLIIEWANGAQIELYHTDTEKWVDAPTPLWFDCEYRVKPEPKPDVVVQFHVEDYSVYSAMYFDRIPNLKLTFDGETGELKAAEVMR
jgi:hypothetical protein